MLRKSQLLIQNQQRQLHVFLNNFERKIHQNFVTFPVFESCLQISNLQQFLNQPILTIET